MKKIILFLFLSAGTAFSLVSCDKKSYCVSCIAEDSGGVTQNFEQVCSEDQSYTNGFASGFKKSSGELGYTSHCSKYISK